jgi:hypothetical protein
MKAMADDTPRGCGRSGSDFPTSLERENALVEFRVHSKGYRLERLPY